MGNIDKHIEEIYENFTFSDEVIVEGSNGWERSPTYKGIEFSRKVFFTVAGSKLDNTLVGKFCIYVKDREEFEKFGIPDEVECKCAGEDLGFLDMNVLRSNRIRKNHEKLNQEIIAKEPIKLNKNKI